MEAGEEGVVVRGLVEIDTRQPFRSVKEAVSMFGEKVLAGKIYGNKLKEMQSKENDEECAPQHKARDVTIEHEETKQHFENPREGSVMAHYFLQSLQRELEDTKMELEQLKSRKYDNPIIEELKFVENEGHLEFEKKRAVKFASPNIVEDVKTTSDNTLTKKLKRKTVIPRIGGLFFKKKGNKENAIVKS